MAEYWRLRSQVGQFTRPSSSHVVDASQLLTRDKTADCPFARSISAEAYMTEMRAKLGLDG